MAAILRRGVDQSVVALGGGEMHVVASCCLAGVEGVVGTADQVVDPARGRDGDADERRRSPGRGRA
jgi:hypothetical protein